LGFGIWVLGFGFWSFRVRAYPGQGLSQPCSRTSSGG